MALYLNLAMHKDETIIYSDRHLCLGTNIVVSLRVIEVEHVLRIVDLHYKVPEEVGSNQTVHVTARLCIQIVKVHRSNVNMLGPSAADLDRCPVPIQLERPRSFFVNLRVPSASIKEEPSRSEPFTRTGARIA